MNLEAQTALAAAIAAVANGVADLGKQLAAHPLVQQQPDDSADILKAAEELQGFGSQLETLAQGLNPAPAGASSSDDNNTGTAAAADAAAAPEAGSAEGPGTAEATPEVIGDEASSDQAAAV